MEPTHTQRSDPCLANHGSSERRATFLQHRIAAANQPPDRRRQVSGARILPRVHRDNGT